MLVLCVSPTRRQWVMMLLGLRPLVLTLCTRRPWVLMLLGSSMHPPSLSASIVGPMLAHVAHSSSAQLGSGVDVASWPTLADTRPRSAHASQYAAVCTGVQVQTSVETLTAQSLLLLGRRTVA